MLISCDFTTRLHKDILRAQNYILKQEYQKAIRQYQQILKKAPPDQIKVKIYYQLGELFSTYLSDSKKGIYYFSRIKRVSKDPLWLVKSEERIGEINYIYLKDYKTSIDNYLKLSHFRPKLKKLDFYEYRLALSYLKNDNLKKALNVFNSLLISKEHQYYVNAYYHIGEIYFQKKDWKKAIAYWTKYIKIEKRKDNIIQTKFLIANAYETMEELKRAYNLYYSLLGEYPNTEVVQDRLNSIYARKVARKR